MKFASGANYNGEWVEGERHGHGVMQYANGDEYQVCVYWKKLKIKKGEWVEGERHGHGVMQYANGDEYQVCVLKKKIRASG